jgi:hypothetical protein
LPFFMLNSIAEALSIRFIRLSNVSTRFQTRDDI